MRNPALNSWLGKLAAEAFKKKTTGRSRLVKVSKGGVQDALKDGPTPAAHHPPTRYGSKTQKRGP